MFKYILARLSEASTIRGLIMFAGGIGWGIAPELADHIVAGTIALSGAIGIFTADGSRHG